MFVLILSVGLLVTGFQGADFFFSSTPPVVSRISFALLKSVGALGLACLYVFYLSEWRRADRFRFGYWTLKLLVFPLLFGLILFPIEWLWQIESALMFRVGMLLILVGMTDLDNSLRSVVLAFLKWRSVRTEGKFDSSQLLRSNRIAPLDLLLFGLNIALVLKTQT